MDSGSIFMAFLLVFISSSLSTETPKIIFVKENLNHELMVLVDNLSENELALVWVKDRDADVYADCGIELLDCTIKDGKDWLKATVERVNTSLLFRLLLKSVTRENVDGIWKLMSHNTMPNRILYYSQEIKVHEPIDLAFTNRWSNYGLIIECTHSSASPSIKMTVTLGPSNNLHVPSNHTRAIPVCYGAQCHVMVPKEDLTCGTSTLVVYVYPNLTNSDDDLIYGTKFISTLNLENPRVELSCLTPIRSLGQLVCMCNRTDLSNISTEFIWRVNKVIPTKQPGLVVWDKTDSSILELDESISATEISCQGRNVFGWGSRVEAYKQTARVTSSHELRWDVKSNDTAITQEQKEEEHTHLSHATSAIVKAMMAIAAFCGFVFLIFCGNKILRQCNVHNDA